MACNLRYDVSPGTAGFAISGARTNRHQFVQPSDRDGRSVFALPVIPDRLPVAADMANMANMADDELARAIAALGERERRLLLD